MRVLVVRTMPNFSMDVYANGLVSGLKKICPSWDIRQLSPHPVDRHSNSLTLRVQKNYERFWRFPQLIKHQEADIFHVIDHSEAHIVSWLKGSGKPTVVTCHDLINLFYKENLSNSVKIPMISHGMWLRSVKSMKDAEHIIAVSHTTAQYTHELLNIDFKKISVVPNAAEASFRVLSENTIKKCRQKLGLLENEVCLLNVGSNHPRKNIITILKAVKAIKEKGISIKFIKAGANFTDEDSDFISKNKIENEVVYLGQPEKSSLVEIYNAADVLVAPSLHEGFGITLLEAMACGTPVITSNVSAMPEVVGNAGILIEPTQSNQIVNAVLSIHSSTVYREQLVEKSLARAASFGWENTAKEVARIYEKVITENRK